MRRGDTLSEIAARHPFWSDEGYEALAQRNGIENPDLIYEGESLTLTDARSDIAQSSGEKITALRGIYEDQTLSADQKQALVGSILNDLAVEFGDNLRGMEQGEYTNNYAQFGAGMVNWVSDTARDLGYTPVPVKSASQFGLTSGVGFRGENGTPYQTPWGRAFGPPDTDDVWHYGTTERYELSGEYDTYEEKIGGGFVLGLAYYNKMIFDDENQRVLLFGGFDVSLPIPTSPEDLKIGSAKLGFAATGKYGRASINSVSDLEGWSDSTEFGLSVIPGMGVEIEATTSSLEAGWGVGVNLGLGASDSYGFYRKAFSYDIWRRYSDIEIPSDKRSSFQPRRR